jgi:acyl-CoA synthetase (AMP-forming)/AMP-acid ligase II
VHDRKEDVIVSGGENVSSIEVENGLRSHPAVADVAVVGVPDIRWGESVKAVVVPAPGRQVAAAELIAHARDGLAHYKCPTSVDFIDRLPRTTTGKVQKFILRRPSWADRDPYVA